MREILISFFSFFFLYKSNLYRFTLIFFFFLDCIYETVIIEITQVQLSRQIFQIEEYISFFKMFILYIFRDALYSISVHETYGIIKMEKKGKPPRTEKLADKYKVERGIYKLNSPIFVVSVHRVKYGTY